MAGRSFGVGVGIVLDMELHVSRVLRMGRVGVRTVLESLFTGVIAVCR